MPIYEFYCPDNNKIYSFLARSLSQGKKIPKCPDNPKYKLQKKVSRFAITSGGSDSEQEEDTFAGVDEERITSLMEDMEKEMGGMDDENPNPQQMGKFMRKFGDLLGGSAPAQFDEMVSRLEAGEDAQALEQELGDAFDDADFELAAAFKKLTQGFRPPERDPQLYEMKDYL